MLARLPHVAVTLVLTLHIVRDLDRGYGAAGVVVAACTIGIAIGSPWRGRLIDSIGLRKALIPSVIGETILWPLAAFVPYGVLLVVAFAAGLLMIPIFSVVRLGLSVLVEGDERRTAFAMDGIGTELSFMVGPAAALYVAAKVGTVPVLCAIGVAAGLAGLLLMWFNPQTRSDSAVAEPTAVATSRFAWLSLSVWAVFAASAGAMVVLVGTDISILATLERSQAIESLGFVLLFWCGASIIGGLVYGAYPRKINPMVLLLWLGLASIPIGFADSAGELAFAIIPGGLLCAPVLTATGEAISDLVAEERRGEAMGWQGTAYVVGETVSSPAVGSAIDQIGPYAGFALAGVVGTVVAAAALMLSRYRQRTFV